MSRLVQGGEKLLGSMCQLNLGLVLGLCMGLLKCYSQPQALSYWEFPTSSAVVGRFPGGSKNCLLHKITLFSAQLRSEINVLLTLPPPCSCRESPSLFPSYREHPGVSLPQEVLSGCGPTKPQWSCSEVRSPRGGLLNSESTNMEGASLRTSAR